MAVHVMDNVFWRMECTAVRAPTVGLAPTVPSHLNFPATTTKITMKVSASLLQKKGSNIKPIKFKTIQTNHIGCHLTMATLLKMA